MLRDISEGGEPEELIEPLKGKAVTNLSPDPLAWGVKCNSLFIYHLLGTD